MSARRMHESPRATTPSGRAGMTMSLDASRLILAGIITFAVLFVVLVVFLAMRQCMAHHYGKRVEREGDVESLREFNPGYIRPSALDTTRAGMKMGKGNNKPLPTSPRPAQDEFRDARAVIATPPLHSESRMPPPPPPPPLPPLLRPLPPSSSYLQSESRSRQTEARTEPPKESSFWHPDSSSSEGDTGRGKHKATKQPSRLTSAFRKNHPLLPKQATRHVPSQLPNLTPARPSWAARLSQIATTSQQTSGESQEVPLLLTPAASQTTFELYPDSPHPAWQGSRSTTPETVVVRRRDPEATDEGFYRSGTGEATTGRMI